MLPSALGVGLTGLRRIPAQVRRPAPNGGFWDPENRRGKTPRRGWLALLRALVMRAPGAGRQVRPLLVDVMPRDDLRIEVEPEARPSRQIDQPVVDRRPIRDQRRPQRVTVRIREALNVPAVLH